jgi:hypothetical protein
MTDATPYPCGRPSEGGALVEAFPRPASRLPVALQGLIDLYCDPEADGVLYLVTAAVAIEHSWGYLERPPAGASPEAGPRAGYYALESLDRWLRWLRWEALQLSPALQGRFAALRLRIGPYFVERPNDPAPRQEPPLRAWLHEMDAFIVDFAAELAPVFPHVPANRTQRARS